MIQKIHLVAACGTGMGTLACMLKEMGYEVTGSDQNIYPPMSDFLHSNGITLFNGYHPDHLNHDPDLVIIGNAVTRNNPEAMAVMERNLPFLSMPQALNRFFAADKKIILITGTHGKTTTASIMAFLLSEAGYDPSFMIGGILKDFNAGFHIGKGPYMVIEGDEYDTAFFDKEAKFLHYDPFVTILTGIEFDHADIFKDLDHIKLTFGKLLSKLRPESHLIATGNCPNTEEIISNAACDVIRYDRKGWTFDHLTVKSNFSFFDVLDDQQQQISIQTKLQGRHNASNILACIAASKLIGIDTPDIQKALISFSGVKRRQEIRGIKRNITVMDDFAHHPSAVRETIHAVKPYYPDGRIIAVFEPRTNTSMRGIFQETYADAFDQADIVCIPEPGMLFKIPEKERFSSKKLVADICKKGIQAYYFTSTQEIIDYLVIESVENDLILIMSNGGFDNIHQRLLEVL